MLTRLFKISGQLWKFRQSNSCCPQTLEVSDDPCWEWGLSMARPWSVLHLHRSEKRGRATFFFFFSLKRCICIKWFDFLVVPMCAVCRGSFPSFQPPCPPQRATLRVVCSRDLFSPLLLSPSRLALCALLSFYTPPWGRNDIFSVNWDGVKLRSFYFRPKEQGLISGIWDLSTATREKGKTILSVVVIIIILRTHWGPLITLLKSMFSLCTTFFNLGKIKNFWQRYADNVAN